METSSVSRVPPIVRISKLIQGSMTHLRSTRPPFMRGGMFGSLVSGINPDAYTLTTKDGTAYRYQQSTGLEKVTDRNGQSLTFTSTGITIPLVPPFNSFETTVDGSKRSLIPMERRFFTNTILLVISPRSPVKSVPKVRTPIYLTQHTIWMKASMISAIETSKSRMMPKDDSRQS